MKTSPREISQFVRYIASGIDASKNPKKELVASDIRCAIAAVQGNPSAISHIKKVMSKSPRRASRTSVSVKASPKEIAKFVRYIASGIDASKNPKKELVASDIRCAIAAVQGRPSAVSHIRKIISAS